MTAQEFLQKASDTISNDPYSRISSGMKKAIAEPKVLFDVHTHAFNWRDIPRDFMQKRILEDLGIINRVFQYWKNDVDLPVYLSGGNRRLIQQLKEDRITLLQILKDKYETEGYHPIFSLLIMDMRAVTGVREDDFSVYKASQVAIKNQYPDNVLLFFPLDPSNSQLYDEFLEAFKAGGDYFGVKVYPSLGYLPSHPKLMPIFKICEEKNIPVTTHCSSASTRSSKREINVTGLDNKTFQPFSKVEKFTSGPAKYKRLFNAPQNWLPVLAHYPTLSLNLAHFGGGAEFEQYFRTLLTIPMVDQSEKERLKKWVSHSSWLYQILTMMTKFQNVYADVSYMIYEDIMIGFIKECIKNVPFTQSRILYGTDYPLSETGAKFGSQFDKIVQEFGADPIWPKLIKENAKEYLFRKNAPELPVI